MPYELGLKKKAKVLSYFLIFGTHYCIFRKFQLDGLISGVFYQIINEWQILVSYNNIFMDCTQEQSSSNFHPYNSS